jgi:hypothetical protein
MDTEEDSEVQMKRPICCDATPILGSVRSALGKGIP